MKIAGVEVAASAIAELAVQLERAGHSDLAQRVGVAVDRNHPIGLTSADRQRVLGVLDPCPPTLEALRDGLRA